MTRLLVSATLAALLATLCLAAPSYNQGASSWYSAQQSCDASTGRLAIPRASDLSDVSGSLPNGAKAWVGARYIPRVYSWQDNRQSTLFQNLGCFSRLPADATPGGSADDVESCFRKCTTDYVALQGTQCSCVLVAPQGSHLPPTSCSLTCADNFQDSCGGKASFSVYSKQTLYFNLETSALSKNYGSACGFLHRDTTLYFDVTLRFGACDVSTNDFKNYICQDCKLPSFGVPCTAIKSNVVRTWDAASVSCLLAQQTLASSFGVNLATVFNVSAVGRESYWIGLTAEEKYQSVDGSDLNAADWNLPTTPPAGKCLAVSKDAAGVMSLQLEDCATSLPSLCEPYGTSTTVRTTRQAGTLPHNLFVTPLTWDDAEVVCEDYGVDLLISSQSDLSDVTGFMKDGTSAWVGGRILHHSWVWSDKREIDLYYYDGCYDNQKVFDKLTEIVVSKKSVLECFSECPSSQYIAIKNETCLCLNGAPSTSSVSESSCTIKCQHDFRKRCGGETSYSVYARDSRFPYKLDEYLSEHGIEPTCAYLSKPPLQGAQVEVSFDACDSTAKNDLPFICQNCTGNTLPCKPVKVQSQVMWLRAVMECATKGMTLATMASGDLSSQFVGDLGRESYWIGLMQDKKTIWIDGAELDPSSYLGGVLDLGGECVAVAKDTAGNIRLQREDCMTKKPFLCR